MKLNKLNSLFGWVLINLFLEMVFLIPNLRIQTLLCAGQISGWMVAMNSLNKCGTGCTPERMTNSNWMDGKRDELRRRIILNCDDDDDDGADEDVDYGRWLVVISISNLVHPVIYLQPANNNNWNFRVDRRTMKRFGSSVTRTENQASSVCSLFRMGRTRTCWMAPGTWPTNFHNGGGHRSVVGGNKVD